MLFLSREFSQGSCLFVIALATDFYHHVFQNSDLLVNVTSQATLVRPRSTCVCVCQSTTAKCVMSDVLFAKDSFRRTNLLGERSDRLTVQLSVAENGCW